MKRSPLPPRKKPLPRSTKAIAKCVPEKRAKRQARTRKLHQSPEYLAAKAEAMERAGNRCEWEEEEETSEGLDFLCIYRCPVTTEDEPLDGHLESYGAVGKIKASRIKVWCRRHHMRHEAEKRPWNRGRIGK